MGFLSTCWNDDERTDQFSVSTLGLIGDFGDTYKAAVRDAIMQDWVQSAIAYGRQRGASKQARTNASYAQKVNHLFHVLSFLRCSCRPSRISPNEGNGNPVHAFVRLSNIFHWSASHRIVSSLEAALCCPWTSSSLFSAHFHTLHRLGLEFASIWLSSFDLHCRIPLFFSRDARPPVYPHSKRK